jgi:D-alanyl-D-alanine dipeptidase
VPKYCAKPDKNYPTPHMTGGAVDVALINADTGEPFDIGHEAGAVTGTAYPDFHEGYHLAKGQSDIENSPKQVAIAPQDSQIVRARRVLFYTMTQVAGLACHPGEMWHYGKGDALSAYVSGSQEAYYGMPTLPDWYQTAIDKL